MVTFLARLFKRRSQRPLTVAHQDQLHKAASDAHDEEEEGTDNLAVLRRAVLTREKKVAGYEFFQPDASGTAPIDPLRERSFLKFLESVLSSATLGKRRAFTAVPCRLLFDPLLEKLAKAGLILLVRFDADAKNLEQFAERMQVMRSAGMALGLADARIALEHPHLGDCASLGFLPVDQIIPPDLLQSVRTLTTRHPRMQLCATGVNTYEEFEVCRRLRIQGFIGPFATHRRDWQRNKIDPGTLRLGKMVASLRAGAEMDAIINDIKLDPLLSYRILGYANSAGIGAQRKILALKDAILLIGREPLFRWLVLLLCASAPSGAQDSALLENALVRGRMMELLAEKTAQAPAEYFFLTGVLSLLDVILQLPAPDLWAALDLPDEVKAALLERQGPYAGLLRLVQASEQAQTESVGALCAELGVEPQMLGAVQTEALIWARGQSQGDADEATFVTEPAATAEVHAEPPTIEHEHEHEHEQEQEQPDFLPTEPQAQANDPQFEEPQPDETQPDETQPDETQPDETQPDEPESQCALAARYAHGDGVAQDLAMSLEWYTKAALQGNAKAQWNVAVMHLHGQGGAEMDAQQAALWCQKAADQGFAPAQATLGQMYATGQGVEQDIDKALALLEQAAIQGDAEAQYNLAVLNEQGQEGEQNLEQARVWFSMAAEQGLSAAQERLGLMYGTGQGVEQDLIEAYKWFFIASEGQHASAKANLEHSMSLMGVDQVIDGEYRAREWIKSHAEQASG